MGNKVKFNLKNVHAAKLIEKEAEGVTTFSYETPRAIPGAVSISLDAEGETSPFYADGIVYFRSVTNNGYSGDLEIALIPEWFRTEILQEILDSNGVLIENSTKRENVKFALLFEFDGDVNAIRHVLYNCTASRPSIESETKEDTIEPGTETLSLTADPRSDGLVKSRTGDNTSKAFYDSWYKAVYVPANATECVNIVTDKAKDLYGLKCNALIGDDVKVAPNGEVTGTFHHVEKYAKFSGNTSEQTGWFFPITLSDAYTGKPVTVKRLSGKGSVKTDTDTEWVLRLTDEKDTVYSFSADGAPTLTLSFSGSNLEPKI